MPGTQCVLLDEDNGPKGGRIVSIPVEQDFVEASLSLRGIGESGNKIVLDRCGNCICAYFPPRRCWSGPIENMITGEIEGNAETGVIADKFSAYLSNTYDRF